MINDQYFEGLQQKTSGAFLKVGENSDIDLCQILSGQVSLAITYALLHKQAQQAIIDITQAYDATLEGWSRLLDLRDHMTDEHTHRVADITVKLASRMGSPITELEHIHRGALLNEIGKMGIPDSILLKPDVLSEAEWTVMKTHPLLAYQILTEIEYLKPAVDLPFS